MSLSISVSYPSLKGLGTKVEIVKANQNTLLGKIIEDLVAKIGLDTNSGYRLKQNKKVLDSSLTVRFAGLNNLAKLELIKFGNSNLGQTNKLIKIALQLEDGTRLVNDFSSLTNLLNILYKFEIESKGKLNLLNRIDGEEWVSPVCLILNQQYFGLDSISTTTLNKLGLNGGNAVIKLGFKNSGMSYHDIKHKIKSDQHDETKKDEVLDKVVIDKMQDDVIKEEVVKVNQLGLVNEAKVTINKVKRDDLFDHQPKVYLAPPPNSTLNNIPDDEMDYELSSTELKMILSNQQANLKKLLEGEPLKTSKMREMEQLKKLNDHQITTLRIKFPDLTQLQLNFLSTDTMDDVIFNLKSYLSDNNSPFTLFRSPPMEKLSNIQFKDKTLFQLNLSPKSLIHFQWVDHQTNQYLHSDWLNKAIELPNISINPTQPNQKEFNQPTNIINQTKTTSTDKKSDNKFLKFLKLSKPTK